MTRIRNFLGQFLQDPRSHRRASGRGWSDDDAMELDPAHAVNNVQLVEEFAARQTQGFRQYVILLGVFSVIALVLAVIGIYGPRHLNQFQKIHARAA
jgi:hypothetical protein